jgi:hypothetical protein
MDTNISNTGHIELCGLACHCSNALERIKSVASLAIASMSCETYNDEMLYNAFEIIEKLVDDLEQDLHRMAKTPAE